MADTIKGMWDWMKNLHPLNKGGGKLLDELDKAEKQRQGQSTAPPAEVPKDGKANPPAAGKYEHHSPAKPL